MTAMDMDDRSIGPMIRAARKLRRLSQYALANELAAVSGKATIGRDRIARWENGRQVPRREWRQWLAVVLQVPAEQLDAGAAAARRRGQVGPAVLAVGAQPGPARRPQGTPALLPVFRSRVQAGILAATLLNTSRAFSLTELAHHAGGSLAAVSKEARVLEDAGILVIRHDGAIRLTRSATDTPMLAPLTELIRVTYGVPQIIGEEFGRVSGIHRIALTGTWADRFAGITGPEPESIEVRLTPADRPPSRRDLTAAAHRAHRRLKRAVNVDVVNGHEPAHDAGTGITWQGDGNHPVVHVTPTAITSTGPAAGAWPQGAGTITRMLDSGELELISGAATDCTPYIELAASHLAATELVKQSAPSSAFVLVCQAPPLIGTGLLAAQGLRAAAGSSAGVIGRSVTAQFGPQFRQVELLRQRLQDMNTPVSRDNRVTLADVEATLPAVHALLRTATELVAGLPLFS